MYSKNDYRYYIERQCMESDDFLMHYGVKGMKWKKHKYAGVSGWLSAKKASKEANISKSVDAVKRKASRLGSAAKSEFASARRTANRELGEAKRSAASAANKAKRTVNRELRDAKRTAKAASNKAKSTANKTKRKASQGIASAKKSMNSAANKAKKQARKAYKYADDHVDRYSYSSRNSHGSYRSTGVRFKTKNTTTDVGVYSNSSSRINRKGKSRSTGGDLGFEYARNNKKKRKASYGSAGIGTRYGVPVQVYRYRSKKY